MTKTTNKPTNVCMTVSEPLKSTKKQAKCTYGCKNSLVESNPKLPFFKHRPDHEYDEYYCGCRGWN